MPDQEIATREQVTPQQTIVQRLRSEGFKQQLAIALPENVTPDRFVRAALTAILQNADLVNADLDSLFQSVIKCAQDGLYPDGREAALVIYNTKVQTAEGERWIPKVQYMPMIGGFRKIAAEHGWQLRTQAVYAGDTFEHELGVDETVVHRPARPGTARGGLIAAYAVGQHRDGRKQIEVMYEDQIAQRLAKAKSKNIWQEWPAEMWEKTVGRRLFKKLPLDPADRRISRMIEAAELDPAESAVALYGPRARGALTQGSPGQTGTVDPTASALGDARIPGSPADSGGDPPYEGSEDAGTAGTAPPSEPAAANVPAFLGGEGEQSTFDRMLPADVRERNRARETGEAA